MLWKSLGMSFLALPIRFMKRTHFAQIARHLADAIADDVYPVGSTLPTELELRDQFQTSRHTIRAALHELQQLGLVSRKKNAGTRVESRTPVGGFRPSLASVDDVVQFGAEHLRLVQSVEEVPAVGELAGLIGCPDGARWLRISSLRIDGDRASAPIGWTDVYINADYTDIAEAARKEPDVLVSALIEKRYGTTIHEIQQNVHATLISDAMAARLRVQAGAAALEIVRRYFDADGEVFEVSVTVHPAERFSVSMRLTR